MMHNRSPTMQWDEAAVVKQSAALGTARDYFTARAAVIAMTEAFHFQVDRSLPRDDHIQEVELFMACAEPPPQKGAV
eukprot:5966677-Prymnesium_polylepis.1